MTGNAGWIAMISSWRCHDKFSFLCWDRTGGRGIIQALNTPFPPVGIVGAADGKNRRAFLCPLVEVFL